MNIYLWSQYISGIVDSNKFKGEKTAVGATYLSSLGYLTIDSYPCTLNQATTARHTAVRHASSS